MSTTTRFLAAAAAAFALLCAAPSEAQAGRIVVNGSALDARTLHALEAAYRTRLPDGHYWYDPRSGLWGPVGGPSLGQIAPGLPLGRLDPRASVGRNAGITGVYVNGREIHPAELARLQRLFGRVVRARYWMDARGVAGYEGGPPQFDLRAAAARQGGGGGGYTRRTPGGGIGSDGRCSYYSHPDGPSVMTGDC